MKARFNLLLYAFKNAFVGMKRHWPMVFSCLVTVFLTMSLVGLFYITRIHVDLFADHVMQDLSIHVVLDEEQKEDEQTYALQNQILALDNVSRVTFSNKDQELELMIAEKGDAFSIYLGEQNPLSHAFYVYVDDESKLPQTANAILALDGVTSAIYGGTSVRQMVEVLDWVKYAAFGFTLLLFLLSLYLIYNTIKAAIYSRQSEIAIMRSVGATSSFIRIPFEIEGVCIGLVGAAIPVLLIYWGYPLLYEALQGEFFIPLFKLMTPEALTWQVALILLITGGAAGLFASILAAGRSIRNSR